MSKSVITDSLLTGIADAIREKTGGEASLTPAEMITEIESISGGAEGGSSTPKELAYLLINKTLKGNTTLFPNVVPLVDFGPVTSLPQSYFLKNSMGGSTNGFGMDTNVSKIVCPKISNIYKDAMAFNSNGTPASSDYQAVKEAYFPVCSNFYSGACSGWGYARTLVLDNPVTIASNAFQTLGALASPHNSRVYINSTKLRSISNNAFVSTGLVEVFFTGTAKPGEIAQYAFSVSSSITDIYVPWSEGEVSNAPWGATNATIHYNIQSEPPATPTA